MIKSLLSALTLTAASTLAVATPSTYLAKLLPPVDVVNWVEAAAVVKVNSLGHAVVEGFDQNGGWAYFFWSSKTGYIEITRPNGAYLDYVIDFDNQDRVLCSYGDHVSAVWTPNGFAVLTPTKPAQKLLAYSTNDRGVFVGQLFRSGDLYAFIEKGMDPAVRDGALGSSNLLINNVGQIVQSDAAGALTLIDGEVKTPIVTPYGPNTVRATGMNDKSEISFTGPVPFYWSTATGYVATGLSYGGAAGISRDGTLLMEGAMQVDEQPIPYIWTLADGLTPVVNLIAPSSDPLDPRFDLSAISSNGILGGFSSVSPVLLFPQN
jgi:hypothetical protein